jgi:hypothetical protein
VFWQGCPFSSALRNNSGLAGARDDGGWQTRKLITLLPKVAKLVSNENFKNDFHSNKERTPRSTNCSGKASFAWHILRPQWATTEVHRPLASWYCSAAPAQLLSRVGGRKKRKANLGWSTILREEMRVFTRSFFLGRPDLRYTED